MWYGFARYLQIHPYGPPETTAFGSACHRAAGVGKEVLAAMGNPVPEG